MNIRTVIFRPRTPASLNGRRGCFKVGEGLFEQIPQARSAGRRGKLFSLYILVGNRKV